MVVDETVVDEAALELEVETAVPTPTDNSPRPEDGVQPTEAEMAALIAAILNDEDEEDESVVEG